MSYWGLPPPPLPLGHLPSPAGNVASFKPPGSPGKDSRFQDESAPSLKRTRNKYDHKQDSEAFKLMNTKTSQSQGNYPLDISPTESAPSQSLNPRTGQPNQMGMKGASRVFYKTRMCAKFRNGTCRDGESCTYAHGVEDMHKPPPNWQEIFREKNRKVRNWDDDQRMIYRMKICRIFYNGGECPFGDTCRFRHESPSRFETDITRPSFGDNTAISIDNVCPVMEHTSNTRQAEHDRPVDAIRVNMKPWRTKICTKWETGQCPFGERCQYAHGESELQVHGAHIKPKIESGVHSIPTKALTQPGNDALHTQAEANIPWKPPYKKINRIYGDWLEDLIPPKNFKG